MGNQLPFSLVEMLPIMDHLMQGALYAPNLLGRPFATCTNSAIRVLSGTPLCWENAPFFGARFTEYIYETLSVPGVTREERLCGGERGSRGGRTPILDPVERPPLHHKRDTSSGEGCGVVECHRDREYKSLKKHNHKAQGMQQRGVLDTHAAGFCPESSGEDG